MQIIHGIKDESIKKIKTEEKVAGSAEEESAILVSKVSVQVALIRNIVVFIRKHTSDCGVSCSVGF